MASRIFEEAAVIVKKNYTVRVIEFKESGKEYTEISVYSKDVTEKNNEDYSDYFAFCFTVRGKADAERQKIDNMTDPEFEDFVKIMTHFIEKKYHIKYKPVEKKEDKKAKQEEKKLVIDNVESMTDFNVDDDPGPSKV